MSQPLVEYHSENHIATITMNDPKTLNAFSTPLKGAIMDALDKADQDADVRVIVLQGSNNNFSSGGHIGEMLENVMESEALVAKLDFMLREVAEVSLKLRNIHKPIIAKLEGAVAGAGMNLALTCDFRIAAENTLLGLTETSLAIIPAAGGTQRLPRLIGESKAMELILTARRLKPAEALDYGLVTRVAPLEELAKVTGEFADSMLANGPIALQQAKFAIKNGMNADLQTGLHIERKAYELTIPTEDRVEALLAFGEKRKPVFKGK